MIHETSLHHEADSEIDALRRDARISVALIQLRATVV